MRVKPRFSTYRAADDDYGGAGTAPPKTVPPEAAPPAIPPQATPPVGVPTSATSISCFLQYAYFLRFPILGWFSLPLLCFLDGCTGASSITRGIMTMSRGWQLFHVTFFVVALQMTILVCTRNIVINGPERFSSEPPGWLGRIAADFRSRTMWAFLAFMQLPALFTLVYVGARTISEQTGWAHGRTDEHAVLESVWPYGGWHGALYLSVALGLLAAWVFWYLVTVFYHWTYPSPGQNKVAKPDRVPRPPVPLIFPSIGGPSGLTARATHSEKPLFAEWLEWIAERAVKLTYVGYAAKAEKPLYELHFLSIVSLAAILLLYLFLNPLIAPVVVSGGFSADTILAVIIFIGFALGAIAWKKRHMELTGAVFTSIIFALLLLFLALNIVDARKHVTMMETSFPTLGAILVILIFFQWLFSGATFFLDRFRVPVLTVVLAIIFVPKFLPINQEHYFAANRTTELAAEAVDSPAAAIEHRLKGAAPSKPLIIVTAMGGGIQAAEWTSQIMARLEATVRNDAQLQAQSYTFHDHLLLASGVSGGSVGLLPFLLEYTAPAGQQFQTAPAEGGRDLLTARLTSAPGCSGLEAVAWGLEYYDLQRLLLTVPLNWLQRTNTGALPDRTWALTEALNRNLKDKDCGTQSFASLAPISDGQQMTLVQTARALGRGDMPAFTFNTTVAETGDRFLLSNYAVPANSSSTAIAGTSLLRGSGSLPAESFLQAYTMATCCDRNSGGKGLYADLSLATAARLSATFPVVSSGTRLPLEFAPVASHFLDGGYYDNDGTASAIEFLASAMRSRAASSAPLPILLVEIRDSDDLDPQVNEDDLAHQTGAVRNAYGAAAPKPWSTFGQMMAPLSGMWNAGHKSTTRRNRRELCLLETAYSQQLDIHHVIFGIPAQVDRQGNASKGTKTTYKASPLSWKLTEGQKQYITHWANDEKATMDSLADSIAWLKQPQGTTATCTVDDQPR